MYWEEVYPRLGETHMRLAMETEMIYAADEPFMDYGIDLEYMALREQGYRVDKMREYPVDFKHENNFSYRPTESGVSVEDPWLWGR